MTANGDTFPFEVDRESTLPPWLQLRKRLLFLIESGYFKPGDQLPKIRELAVEISMNFNTVNKAYLSLQSDGYLKSVRGRGVFVADSLPICDMGSPRDFQAILDDFLHACKGMGLTYEEAAEQVAMRAKMLTMAETVPYRMPGSNLIAFPPFADDSVESKEA